jgi:type II secretory pathway component PulF
MNIAAAQARLTLPFSAFRARCGAAADAWLRRLSPPALSTQERIFFAQRLAFLIDGGVPILDGLRMMAGQMRSRRCVRIIDALRDDVANGQSLSRSLRKFPAAFETMAVTLIDVGESCGLLSQNLHYLADELKKRRALRRKVTGALLYPALVIVATACITVFLTVSLLPKLMPMFMSLHMTLPASTRAVMAVSAFLQKRGLMLLDALTACMLVLAIAIRRSVRVRIGAERIVARLPVAGTLVRGINVAHFSRAVGLLLGSMTLRDALTTYASMCGSALYKERFIAMGDAVERGEQMSACLRDQPRTFPELFAQMIAVGEQSGKLRETLFYLSDHYEREIDDAARDLSSLVEPVLMLGTGAVVGFIALSIITPMYAITQNLHA